MLRIDWRKEGCWRVIEGQQARLFHEVQIEAPCRLVREGKHGWLEVDGIVEAEEGKAIIRKATQ